MLLRRLGPFGWMLLVVATMAAPLSAGTPYGKISGLVVDAAGTPQMGASVWVGAEDLRAMAPVQLLTNDRGAFSGEKLLPGLYTVRVTLAGFLPTIERHVKIEPELTTILRLELSSVFTSFERLRSQPKRQTDADEWMWVLRASASTRPILRYADGEVTDGAAAESAKKHNARGRVELTSGSGRPGSTSNLADAPAMAFAYEQGLGRAGRLIFAGQASYERSASAGFATTWLPTGEPGRGSRTTMVLRRSYLGPTGPVFSGARLDHSSTVTIGDRFALRYGAEFLLANLGRSTSSLRPRGELAMRMAPSWTATFTVAPRPLPSSEVSATPQQSALNALDSFPSLMVRNGRPVLESGWHEELAVEHQLGPSSRIVASIFRDTSSHTAIFGRGRTSNPDILQDFFSNAFAYDGGESASWGTRVTYRQKLFYDFEAMFLYAFAGALAVDTPSSTLDLRDNLSPRYRHSLGAKLSGRVQKTGTSVSASYKWVNGNNVSRQDPYGEALNQMDPALSLTVRQPLPRFIFAGRMEALADFRNLLAQGYVPVNTPDGQVLLVPMFRTFRGGLSFQF